jgi:hypothetical protein
MKQWWLQPSQLLNGNLEYKDLTLIFPDFYSFFYKDKSVIFGNKAIFTELVKNYPDFAHEFVTLM